MATSWVRSFARLARSRVAREDARHEWRRRLRGEPRLPDGPLRRVLVLCHGNICRSPFAAALLAGRLPALEVRSAGLEAGEGNPADPSALRCARRAGVSLDAHRSARASTDSLSWADLILVMQGSQFCAIERQWPHVAPRTFLLGDFLLAPPFLLPDPWGEDDRVFEQVFTRVATAVENLAQRIEATRSSSSP